MKCPSCGLMVDPKLAKCPVCGESTQGLADYGSTVKLFEQMAALIERAQSRNIDVLCWQAAAIPMRAWNVKLNDSGSVVLYDHVRSSDPLQTPRLRSVAVEAKVTCPRAPDWANALQVVSFHNEEIHYTSLPFEYESSLHPRLVALRRKYKLDEVVSGAASETAQLVRLRNWVARQWSLTCSRPRL